MFPELTPKRTKRGEIRRTIFSRCRRKIRTYFSDLQQQMKNCPDSFEWHHYLTTDYCTTLCIIGSILFLIRKLKSSGTVLYPLWVQSVDWSLYASSGRERHPPRPPWEHCLFLYTNHVAITFIYPRDPNEEVSPLRVNNTSTQLGVNSAYSTIHILHPATNNGESCGVLLLPASIKISSK